MIAATGLVGCTPGGKIDCATIVVMGNSGEILEEESETSHSYVYEYVSDDGKKIYTTLYQIQVQNHHNQENYKNE